MTKWSPRKAQGVRNMQDSPYLAIPTPTTNRKRITRIVIVAIGIVIAFSIFLTLFTTGIVDTSRIDRSYKITIYALNEGKLVGEPTIITAGNGFGVLAAGKYSVQFTKNDTKFHYSAQLNVQNFWRKTVLVLDSKKQASSLITTPVAGTEALNSKASFSFRTGGTVLFNDNDPLAQPIDTCATACFEMQPYNDGLAIGLLGETGRAKRVAMLASETTTPTTINDQYYADKSQLVVDTKTGSFAIYDDKKSISYYVNQASIPKSITITTTPAKGDTGRLIAISGDTIAVISGGDYTIPESGDGIDSTETPDGDYTLTTYSAKTGAVITKSTIRNHSAIKNIAISPDGKHFALTTATAVEAGLVGDGTIITAWSEQSYMVSWFTDDIFAYATNNGLYSSTTTTAWPVLASKTMTISTAHIIGDKLWATVLFSDDADQLSFPIIVDPTNIELANNLLNYKPIKSTRYYSIEFTGEKFHLYIPSLSDGSKPSKAQIQPAYDYMSLAAPDAKVIVFE